MKFFYANNIINKRSIKFFQIFMALSTLESHAFPWNKKNFEKSEKIP
jgi:hypothetical protein